MRIYVAVEFDQDERDVIETAIAHRSWSVDAIEDPERRSKAGAKFVRFFDEQIEWKSVLSLRDSVVELYRHANAEGAPSEVLDSAWTAIQILGEAGRALFALRPVALYMNRMDAQRDRMLERLEAPLETLIAEEEGAV